MSNRRFERRAGIRQTWAAMAMGLALLAGCATTPCNWGPRGDNPTKPVAGESQATTPAPPKSSGSPADAKSLQQVMSELQQIGTSDPAAQDKLMADLQRTDPSLWPGMLQTYRAKAAYQQREEQRESERQHAAGLSGGNLRSQLQETPAADAPRESPSARLAGEHETHFELKPSALQPSSSSSATDRFANSPSPPAPFPSGPVRQTGVGSELAVPSSSLPSIVPGNDRPALSPEPPMMGGIDSLTTTDAATARPSAAGTTGGGPKPTPQQSSKAGAAPAEPLSTAARLAATRNEAFTNTEPLAEADRHLTAAIRSIELESKAGSRNESDIALQARLHMLYLLAGRRDDALRPLPAAPPAAQE